MDVLKRARFIPDRLPQRLKVAGVGKIALFLPALNGGGAERAVIKLAEGFLAKRVPVDLVVAKAIGPYVKQIPAGTRFIDLGASRALASLPALMRYLRRERPAALLSTLERSCIVALWARRLTGTSTRIVVNVQNHISVDSKNAPNIRVKYMPRFVGRFYPWADAITTVSRGVAEDLAHVMHVPPERVRVIFNPVISDDLFAAAAEPIEHPWFAAGMPPVILSVGRLSPQKDFDLLLRAFARVRASRSARLIVLGEGPERGTLTALAEQMGIAADVEFPGYVENPYGYMSRAAAFALSSRWEGLPTVLIEALACRVPVLSTDCPSGPYEILAGGKYGSLVRVGDEHALASGLHNILAARPPSPPDECWRPYHQDIATAKYLKLLLPKANGISHS